MSKYPNQLDDDVDLPSVNDNITEMGGEAINALRTSIFAIQSALGEDPQGSASDLKTRLAYFFNDDGTPKQSALVASGLIALPITDPMIASNAGILESKLDLDFPTQVLQNEITSNDTDITELQDLYNHLLFDLTQHFLGAADKHDGYDIIFDNLPSVSTIIDSVSLAVHYIWVQFLAHKNATSGIEHYASAIAYTPTINGPITATNVQDAISQIDTSFYEDRRRHDDSAHSNGVSSDGYILSGGQIAVNDASARVVRIPSSPNIIKLGLINAAVVKTKGFDSNGIGTSTNALRIDISTGIGISRSLTITGLQTAQYPVGYNRVSLKAIVDYLNLQFQLTANHFPVTAFESDDGELVLQHNIAHPTCGITIKSSSNTAVNTLGFSDIVDVTSGYVDNYYLSVDGYRYSELSTVSSGNLVQATTSSSVDIGISASGLGIEPNTLFHVFNHTNAAANGTYRVVGTIINSVILNTTLTSGTFSYIIYKDIIDSNFSGNFKTIDLYIDSHRNVRSSIRQETTLVQVSGLKIIEVSQDFVAATGSMTLNFSSPNYSVFLTISGVNGPSTSFEQGFRGYKTVYAPNNKSYITVFIFDPAPAVGTDQIAFYSTEKQDDLLLLGTTHTDAASVIEFPLNRRNVGLTGISNIGSEVIDDIIQDDIKNLHINGIIRGFDIIQINPGSLSVTLNGGQAYVEGRKIIKPRVSIDITKTAATDGNWNLLLAKNGTIEIYNDTAAGFSVADILSGAGYSILAQLVVSGGIVTEFTDARIFINDIESKLDLIVDDQEFGAGQFRTLESAVLNAQFSPNNNKTEIKIVSDLVVNEDVIVNSDTNIVSFRNLTINGNLLLLSGAKLQSFGSLIVTGVTSVGANSILTVGGGTLASVSLSTDSILNIVGNTNVSNISITGDNTLIIGSINRPVLTFDGTNSGIQFIGAASNVIISDLELVMTYSINSIINISTAGSYSNIIIKNNLFRQSTPFTFPSPTISRQGLYVNANVTLISLQVTDNIFRDLSHGIEINNSTLALHDILIRNNIFTNSNKGVEIVTNTGTASGIVIEENTFSAIFNQSARIVSNTTGSLAGIAFNFNIENNNNVLYSPAITTMLEVNFGCSSALCASNIAVGMRGVPFSIQSNSSVITSNLIDTCDAAILVGSTSTTIIANNLLRNNTGLSLSIASTVTSEITGNICITANTGTIYSLDGDVTCIGNKFIDGGTLASSFIIPNGAVLIGNLIQSGRIFMSGGGSRQSITSNNILIANGLNLTNTFEILPASGTTELAIFSNNIIQATGTLSAGVPAVRISTAGSGNKMIFSGNAIRANTGRSILGIGPTFETILVSGNHLLASNGASPLILSRGVEITTSNVYYTNNLTEGKFSIAEVDVSGTNSNIFISNNILNGDISQAGGQKINIASTLTSTIAKNNKNVVESLTYSVLNALQYSSTDWTFNFSLPTTFEITSASISGYLVIPLQGLPVGARLENIHVYVTTPGAGSTLSMRVFKRPSTSHILTELGSAINNNPSVFQVMTTLFAPQNILDDNEYFVVMTSTAINNTIGQVVVDIRI